MKRTRRLHARLACVMSVENRASIAYAAARTRGVDAVGLRIARLAYVMCFSLGTRAHVMHKATANTLIRTLRKSFQHALTPSDNRKQRKSFSASSAPTIAVVLAARQRQIQTRDTKQSQCYVAIQRLVTRAPLLRFIRRCTVTSVAAPIVA